MSWLANVCKPHFVQCKLPSRKVVMKGPFSCRPLAPHVTRCPLRVSRGWSGPFRFFSRESKRPTISGVRSPLFKYARMASCCFLPCTLPQKPAVTEKGDRNLAIHVWCLFEATPFLAGGKFEFGFLLPFPRVSQFKEDTPTLEHFEPG